MGTSLYQLTENMRQLEKLAEEGELDAQTLKDTVEGVEGEFDEKALAIVTVMNGITAQETRIANEIDRLAKRKKTLTNKVAWLKDYLLTNMDALGKKKISDDLFTIALVAGKPMAIVTDVDALDVDYIKLDVKKSPIKADILKALKALPEGETLAGATMGQSKLGLKIS